jgi:hypothetical protein
MKVKTHQCLSRGEFRNLKLILGPASIRPKGKVAHSVVLPSRECLLGVQFTDLSVQDRRLLRECLATLEEGRKPRGMLYAGKKQLPDTAKVGQREG